MERDLLTSKGNPAAAHARFVGHGTRRRPPQLLSPPCLLCFTEGKGLVRQPMPHCPAANRGKHAPPVLLDSTLTRRFTSLPCAQGDPQCAGCRLQCLNPRLFRRVAMESVGHGAVARAISGAQRDLNPLPLAASDPARGVTTPERPGPCAAYAHTRGSGWRPLGRSSFAATADPRDLVVRTDGTTTGDAASTQTKQHGTHRRWRSHSRALARCDSRTRQTHGLPHGTLQWRIPPLLLADAKLFCAVDWSDAGGAQWIVALTLFLASSRAAEAAAHFLASLSLSVWRRSINSISSAVDLLSKGF